jgi:oligopeptidase A
MLYPYTSQTFPRFENITNRDCFNALGKSLLEFEAEVLHFEDKCKQGTTDFDELFSAIDAVKCQFETVWSLVNLMQLVTDKLDSDTFIKLHDRAKRSLSSRLNSDVIYQHLKKLLDAHGNDKPFLTPEQEHTLLRFMVEFKHQGFHLVANKQEELHGNWLKNLMGKKADYKLRMRINNDRYQHTMYNAEVVKDFPLDVLKAMAHDSTQPSRGPWTLTLHPYVYKQHMAYCPDRQLRYGAHYAHVTRGSKQVDVESHVTAITFDIRQLRLDQAVCLGYKSYAQVSMDSKMAKSTENVHALIKNLAGKAKESQESELDALQSYAESRGFDEELQTYDVEYFKRKQRRTILGMSDDDMRDFFPLPRVLEGINRLSSRLFGIDYVQVEDSLQQGAWHPDTQLWAVRDVKTQQILGHFYLDPYMRDDKGYAGGDHGWYVPIRAGCKFGPSKPLGAMVFALPSASAGKPSLLSFFEAQEVLRNFGLMLQHILCQNEYTDNSGKKGMEVDALNFAGDFMSLLIHNASVLRSLSGHWKYKQPLAEETIQHLCTTIKHHMAGYDLCRELYLAEFDLLFHSDDPDDYQDIEENLYKEYFLLPKVNGDSAPLYFA